MIDVIVVPDFSSWDVPVFTARTLFFLGSWLEHPGKSRNWPLHVACVGDPPPCVRELAAQCGASLTVHPNPNTPKNIFLNKFMGFKIRPKTKSFFLIDVDILINGDLSPLAEMGPCISALPNSHNLVPMEIWETLYAHFGVPLSEDRILCLRGQYSEKLRKDFLRHNELEPMPPYFNGGVLLAPWESGLHTLWEQYTRNAYESFAELGGDWRFVANEDQATLAVAIAKKRQDGVSFVTTPPEFHGNYVFYWSGVLNYADTRLFHAIELFRCGDREKPLDVIKEVDLYEAHLLRGVYTKNLGGRVTQVLHKLSGADGSPVAIEIKKLVRRIKLIVERYVAPGMEKDGINSFERRTDWRDHV